MYKLFPSQFFFEPEKEEKFIEWLFDKVKTLLFVVCVNVVLTLLVFVIIQDYSIAAFETVLILRVVIIVVSALLGLSLIFFRALRAQRVLFAVLMVIAFMASVDTFIWVGKVEVIDSSDQMLSIILFMVVPFLNSEHKFFIGALLISGVVFTGYYYNIADYYWAVGYMLVVFAFSMVIYYQFDLLLRTQFKAVTEERAKSNYDQLTGVYNRKALDSFFGGDLDRVGPGQRIVVGMLDIDFFKNYNDTYGHIAGDRILEQIARALTLFDFDKVYRFGGEEFLFTWVIAESKLAQLPDISRVIENYKHPHRASGVSEYITVSVGLVTLGQSVIVRNKLDKEFVNRVIRQADDNLYKVKREGRNGMACSEFVE